MKNAVVLLLGLAASACATSPLGRSQLMLLPDSQMTMLGDQSFAALKREVPVEPDRQVNDYVRCVADAVTLDVGGSWDVALFRQDSPNAFALPGGKIGVHTGMLRIARNQDQLATVLAHEVAHVLSRHANERLSQQVAVQQGLNIMQALADPASASGKTLMGLLGLGAQYGILMPYSRTQESEADLLGLDLMARAGFDPRQSIELWNNMESAGGGQPIEFLSTHPSHATRIQDLAKRMPHALDLQRQAAAKGRRPQCDGVRLG
ncbi:MULTISPECIES: M48 family metallopeptidase [Methylococcus]|uniref:M48 family metallopeptidase n=1 Tax=Methylococcus capsulatus TaxID=414 RepID=A0ABZ2F6B7_METCP|nr:MULTISPECIES: M48 family metallopeptidase [Methylococcus]MDF9393032.1 M48 family peptidase [Methylococcus capsulatus]